MRCRWRPTSTSSARSDDGPHAPAVRCPPRGSTDWLGCDPRFPSTWPALTMTAIPTMNAPERKHLLAAPVRAGVVAGDCLEVLRSLPAERVDLIVTSPPYADQRASTYGGVTADDYVDWFLPRAEQLLRVLKPTGSLVINIKEKVVDGERHTYVLELILAMSKQGWLWTEEYVWHKRNCFPGKWPNRFRDAWERCLHFTREKRFKMNQDAVMVPMGDWAEHAPEDARRQRRRAPRLAGGQRVRQEHRQLAGPRARVPHQRPAPGHRMRQQGPQRRVPAGLAALVHRALHRSGRHRAGPVRRLRHHARRGARTGPPRDRRRTRARLRRALPRDARGSALGRGRARARERRHRPRTHLSSPRRPAAAKVSKDSVPL